MLVKSLGSQQTSLSKEYLALQGIDVISAQAIHLANNNKISTERFYTYKLGNFYEEFLKCFIGDHRITPYPVNKLDLSHFAQEVDAQNVLMIRGSTEANNQPSRFAKVDI